MAWSVGVDQRSIAGVVLPSQHGGVSLGPSNKRGGHSAHRRSPAQPKGARKDEVCSRIPTLRVILVSHVEDLEELNLSSAHGVAEVSSELQGPLNRSYGRVSKAAPLCGGIYRLPQRSKARPLAVYGLRIDAMAGSLSKTVTLLKSCGHPTSFKTSERSSAGKIEGTEASRFEACFSASMNCRTWPEATPQWSLYRADIPLDRRLHHSWRS